MVKARVRDGKKVNGPELRPEFIKEMRKIQKQKTIKIKNWNSHFGLK